MSRQPGGATRQADGAGRKGTRVAAIGLAHQRDLLRREVLPRYAALAPLAFAGH